MTKREFGMAAKILVILFCFMLGNHTFGQTNEQLHLPLGKSHIMEFSEPVKRVSIADPKIADASVTTPTQILINGIAPGVTSMIVWDERENYQQYDVIVKRSSALHQVRLQVRFAEVKQSAFRQLGADFLLNNRKIGEDAVTAGSFIGKVNSPSIPLGLGDAVDFFLSIPTEKFSTIIKALEEKNLLTLLAHPNLSVMEGEEASFLAGGEFPVPVAQGGISQQVSIQWKEFGVRLKFTPMVLDSQIISLKLLTEVSSLDFENGVTLSGFRIPSLISRRSETTIELRQGDHFAIGGLISNDMSKTISRFPILGQIPILGKLFSSSRFQKNESELIVMVSPEIVNLQ